MCLEYRMTKLSKIICLAGFILASQPVLAINWDKVPSVSVGADVGFKSISVVEKSSGNEQVAKLSKGFSWCASC